MDHTKQKQTLELENFFLAHALCEKVTGVPSLSPVTRTPMLQSQRAFCNCLQTLCTQHITPTFMCKIGLSGLILDHDRSWNRPQSTFQLHRRDHCILLLLWIADPRYVNKPVGWCSQLGGYADWLFLGWRTVNNATWVITSNMGMRTLWTIFNAIFCFSGANGESHRLFKSGCSLQCRKDLDCDRDFCFAASSTNPWAKSVECSFKYCGLILKATCWHTLSFGRKNVSHQFSLLMCLKSYSQPKLWLILHLVQTWTFPLTLLSSHQQLSTSSKY